MADKKEPVKRRVTIREANGEEYTFYEFDNGRYTFEMRMEPSKYKREAPGKLLGIAMTKGYTTMVGPFNLKDLKLLRKLVRKAIRYYEDNESFQV